MQRGVAEQPLAHREGGVARVRPRAAVAGLVVGAYDGRATVAGEHGALRPGERRLGQQHRGLGVDAAQRGRGEPAAERVHDGGAALDVEGGHRLVAQVGGLPVEAGERRAQRGGDVEVAVGHRR